MKTNPGAPLPPFQPSVSISGELGEEGFGSISLGMVDLCGFDSSTVPMLVRQPDDGPGSRVSVRRGKKIRTLCWLQRFTTMVFHHPKQQKFLGTMPFELAGGIS
jgi:hypothetical protein